MVNLWMDVLKDIYARKAKLNNAIERFTWKYKYVAVSATWVLTKNFSSHLIMQAIKTLTVTTLQRSDIR